MFEAVIFDFDGVILDSEPLHYQACSQVLETLGIMLPYTEYVEKFLGYSDKQMFPKIFMEKNYQYSLDTIKTLIEEKTARYQDIIRHCDKLPMIDRVDHYLEYISRTIPKIAICSGSSRHEIMVVLAKLQQGRLQKYFDTIVSSEDVRHGKPSSEGYLLTAERLQVPPQQCLVIEDTPHGIDAAKAAGMYVVGLLTSFTKNQLQHADELISHFSQLIQLPTDPTMDT